MRSGAMAVSRGFDQSHCNKWGVGDYAFDALLLADDLDRIMSFGSLHMPWSLASTGLCSLPLEI
jgi:hypothetical protein